MQRLLFKRQRVLSDHPPSSAWRRAVGGTLATLLIAQALVGCDGDEKGKPKPGPQPMIDAGPAPAVDGGHHDVPDSGPESDDAGKDSSVPPKPMADGGRDADAPWLPDAGSDGGVLDAAAPDADAAAPDAAAPDAGPDEPTYDCNNLPMGPAPFKIIKGPKAAEDFAFDKKGNLWSISSAGNIFTTRFGEAPKLRIPGAAVLGGSGGSASGSRLLVSGDLAVNVGDAVLRVTPQGGITKIANGSYPNGTAIGMDGWVYVGFQGDGKLRRINPDTKEMQDIGDVPSANGVSFSPDYKTVYVGGFGTGTIMQFAVNDDGTFGAPEVFANYIGGTPNMLNGALDGMGVDACGNVYVCEYVAAIVWRISPDGKTKVKIAELGQHTGWIPNMNWGTGYGWEKNILYVSDRDTDQVYAVEVGVPGKKEPHLE